MHLVLRFARMYMLRYLPWYLAGVVALLGTNWLSVTIPLYLADGIDLLEQGLRDGGGVGASAQAEIARIAAIVAGMGVAIIGIRSASRLLFFTPGRYLQLGGVNHAHVLVSICHALGLDNDSFGNPDAGTGPLEVLR